MELHSYIRNLCDKGENTEVEFKSALGGFPNSFWETYSAFCRITTWISGRNSAMTLISVGQTESIPMAIGLPTFISSIAECI